MYGQPRLRRERRRRLPHSHPCVCCVQHATRKRQYSHSCVCCVQHATRAPGTRTRTARAVCGATVCLCGNESRANFETFAESEASGHSLHGRNRIRCHDGGVSARGLAPAVLVSLDLRYLHAVATKPARVACTAGRLQGARASVYTSNHVSVWQASAKPLVSQDERGLSPPRT